MTVQLTSESERTAKIRLAPTGISTQLEGWLSQHLSSVVDRVQLGILCAGQQLRLDRIAPLSATMPETVHALVAHVSQAGGAIRLASALLANEVTSAMARERGLGALLGEDAPAQGVRPPQICHSLVRAGFFQGRSEQLATLDWAWQEGARVIALTAAPGCGKTALLQHWLDGRGLSDPRRWSDFGVEGLFVWSFADDPDVASFLRAAADYVEGRAAPEDEQSTEDGGKRGSLVRLLQGLGKLRGHVLLVLDGLERFQAGPLRQSMGTGRSPTESPGDIVDPELRTLLTAMAAVDGESAVLCTLEREVPFLQPWRGSGYVSVRVPPLALFDGVKLLRGCGVLRGAESDAERRCAEHGGHALTLDLIGRYLNAYFHGDARAVTVSDLPPSEYAKLPEAPTLRRVLRAHVQALTESQRGLLDLCVLLPGPLRLSALYGLAQATQEHLSPSGPLAVEALLHPLRGLDLGSLHGRLQDLARLGLLFLSGDLDAAVVDLHPLLRRLLYQTWLSNRGGRQVEIAERTDLLPRPQDTALLDLLEQLMLVLLQAGLIGEAYQLLTSRMGGYAHLGRNLGEYRRLLAVLRILSPVLATVAGGNPIWRERSAKVATWEAQTLGDLGQIAESLSAANRSIGSKGEPAAEARSWQADAHILGGRLRKASALSTDLWRSSQSVAGRARAALQLARANLLLGESSLSRIYLMEAELCLREEPGALCPWDGRNLAEALDRERAESLLRHGDVEGARPLIARCHSAALADGRGKDLALMDILIGEIARRERDPLDAAQSVHRALAWGSRTGDVEILVRAGLCHARIRMDAGNLDGAASAIGMALPMAMELGLGIEKIELLLVRGYLFLRRGDLIAAEADARDALAYSMASECGYLWGEADALHLLALVLLAGRNQGAEEASLHLADEIEVRERMLDSRAQDVRWLRERLIA